MPQRARRFGGAIYLLPRQLCLGQRQAFALGCPSCGAITLLRGRNPANRRRLCFVHELPVEPWLSSNNASHSDSDNGPGASLTQDFV
jgi:hypothetical protein